MRSAVYDASSIVVYRGLEGVRKRPAMYLGSSGNDALVQAAKEIISNSTDEAMNGFGKEIGIRFSEKSGEVLVWDEGRGIPVGRHKTVKDKDTLTIILTELHAGGKMNDGAYSSGSSGVHGVGSSVVNALSSVFEAWSYRNGKWNYQAFRKGVPVTKVISKDPPRVRGHRWGKAGTVIRYVPDYSCFDKGSSLDVSALKKWVENISWIMPVRFLVIDADKGKEEEIYHKDGFKELFARSLKENDVEEAGVPFIFHSGAVSALIGWVKSSDSFVTSSVSLNETSNGGTHLLGLYDAMAEAFKTLAPKGASYTRESLRKGVIINLNLNMSGPKFSSQDKVKLVSKEAEKEVKDALEAPLISFFKRNKELFNAILNRASEFSRLNEEFKASSKLAAAVRVSSKGKVKMPDGFASSRTRDPDKREMYLVEGQSASGTAKKARFAEYQEIFPLTGKIPNVWKLGEDRTFNNPRIIDLLRAVGYDPKNPKKFRVGKIMLLADSDVDGYHIGALLLGFFQRVMPSLLKEGRVYLVNAPLFMYSLKEGKVYAETLPDMMDKLKSRKIKFDPHRLTRLKGWGEAPWEMLREVAFEPKTRSLTRISAAKSMEDKELLVDMLGEGTAGRKVLLGL